MTARIKLTISDGAQSDQELVFAHRVLCMVGRAMNCHIQLPTDKKHQYVSRHHCLLDIDPPSIWVRDCGSRNGTYVNNAIIGRRTPRDSLDGAAWVDYPEVELRDGDEIRLGQTHILVAIMQGSVETAADTPCREDAETHTCTAT